MSTAPPSSGAAAAPQHQTPQHQSATPPGVNVPAAELRRLTATICGARDGSEGERSVVDTALATARAYDRWVVGRSVFRGNAP
jgi:hypothetical protein